MDGMLGRLISNRVLANVVLITIIAVGVMAIRGMVRESLPNMSFDAINIWIALPGADPEEVEESISRRLEAALDGMEGIKLFHTFSSDGGAYAYVEVADGHDPEQVRDDIEQAINGITTFPAEARPANITIEKEDEEVINLALWGELPERQLKEWAERTRADLQRMPEISQVLIGDTRPYEINIEVSRERLRQHGLTLADVRRAIQAANMNTSAGVIRSEGEEVRIRTVGKYDDGRAYETIVVKASGDGDMVSLGQIAEVRDGFTDAPAFGSFNGHPCVLLELYKTPGDDSLLIAERVRTYAAEKQKELPAGLHISPCFDESEFISEQISMLVRNGLMSLVVVLVILWLFLDSRLAFWAAMGIPISICGAMIVLWATGNSINQITLVAFIIVLGIIVDDAIVVGEAILYHRKRGCGPLEAAVAGVREVGVPVVAAVTTTIIAFVPLMYVPGFIGRIMGIAPVVVIAALAVSIVECLFLLPAHLNHLPANSNNPQEEPRWKQWRRAPSQWLERMAHVHYAPWASRAVKHRYVTLCFGAAALMLTFGVVQGGHVKVDFWPPIDGTYMAGFVEFPQGSPAEVTERALAELEAGFLRVEERTKTSSGKKLSRNIHRRVFSSAPHEGRILIEMIAPSERGIHSQDVSAAWEAATGAIPGAVEVSFFNESIGNGGAPIAIWLTATDMNELRAAAETLKAKLRRYDGVYEVRDDFRPGKTELQVTLKPEAHTLGISLESVRQHLRAGFYGEEALRFQRGREDVLVRVRYPEDERQGRGDLEEARILTANGNEVPLLSVAEVTPVQGAYSIRGTNGQRRIAVLAAVDASKTTPQAVINDLRAGFLDTMVAGYAGMGWSLRGSAEENEETLGGLQRGFVIALLGVFVIIAATFRSYLQPLIIMVVIPFGLLGAVFGHWVLGIPITFLSMFGLIALIGVVVNDAIVLIECANAYIAQGQDFHEAVADAGRRRFRAIFLTTVSTCGGLLPLLLEQDLAAQIVIPMAASVAFGVAFATVITLLFIPALLAILNDFRRAAHRLRHGDWPVPNVVEPAYQRAVAFPAQPAVKPAFAVDGNGAHATATAHTPLAHAVRDDA